MTTQNGIAIRCVLYFVCMYQVYICEQVSVPMAGPAQPTSPTATYTANTAKQAGAAAATATGTAVIRCPSSQPKTKMPKREYTSRKKKGLLPTEIINNHLGRFSVESMPTLKGNRSVSRS